MADIQKLPKHSRIDQQRPPLLAEPVDVGILARMDLPRYQPPRPAHGRSRKKAQSQPPVEPASTRPSPQQAANQASRPVAGKAPAPQPPERTAKPQQVAGQSQGAGQPSQGAGPVPGITRQPLPGSGRFNTPPSKSPYEKRPPFNTNLPARREPPASSGNPPVGNNYSGMKQPGASRPVSGGQPNTNRPSTSSTSPLGGPLPAKKPPVSENHPGTDPQPDRKPLPDVGQPRSGQLQKPAAPENEVRASQTNAPRTGSPADKSKISGIQQPGAGQPAAARPQQNTSQPPEKPESHLQKGTQRPEEQRRPIHSARPTDSRPVERHGTDPRPSQSRLFRLPPLDYNFNEPAGSSMPVDQQDDDQPEEKGPARKDPQPRSAGVEPRPERHNPRTDIDTGNEQEPLPAPGMIPRAEARPDARGAANPAPSNELFPETPSLRDILLNAANTLPAQTAILGVANEDQLPVLLDLNDPAPGSLLVIGDERQRALDLLRVAVSSVALRNTARGVQFVVFSHLPEVWNEWVEEQGLRRYCMGVVGAESSQAREWIYRLSDMAGQRTGGASRGGPPVLVLFDTLSFMTRLLPDARQRLENLIHSGPDVRIWSIAAVSTALAGSLGKQLEPFDTRIWGYSDESSVYTRLAGVPAAEAQEFGVPGQFAVRVGSPGDQAWLKFRLPSLEGLLP